MGSYTGTFLYEYIDWAVRKIFATNGSPLRSTHGSFVYLGPIGLGNGPYVLGNRPYVIGNGLHGLGNGTYVLGTGNGPHFLGRYLPYYAVLWIQND